MNNRFARQLLLALLAVLVISISAFAATGKIQGKVWVVSRDQAANVTFPAPSATPDITFTTNYIAYLGGWPAGQAAAVHCFTISRFLNCGTEAFGVKYSNRPNPYLGNTPVNKNTPMGSTNYGVIMEFTYTENNTSSHTAQTTIYHDDGVALEVNGDLSRASARGSPGQSWNRCRSRSRREPPSTTSFTPTSVERGMELALCITRFL